jgi:tetratricopeptide (TPR) repeat protein
MTDGAFPDRLSQLKARWESDPTSRVFLQLAEEYRHQGRVKEALDVLDKGLKEHPGYLSALVAKGRCHLELSEGEAARAVLERVVKQDATQMVANKLLVRAYLETGEPARARERLDLYSLLNDSDPEIGDLRRQIKQMERPKAQVPESSPFDLGRPAPAVPAPAVPAPAGDDVFDLGPRSVKPAARREVEDVFALDETAAPPPAVTMTPAAPVATVVEPEPFPEEPEIAGDGDLFPELASRASRQRYLMSLASEGIFEVEAVPEAPPAAAAAAPAVDDTSWLEEEPAPVEAPVFDFAPLEPAAPAAPSIEEPADLWPEDELAPLPEPEPAPAAEPAATATLGDLYLRQGHLDEAERIFQEVLRREPDNTPARSGLGSIEEARRTPASPAAPAAPISAPLDAHQLLAGFRPGPAGAGTTARKVFLLNRYLDRLRGRQPHVP